MRAQTTAQVFQSCPLHKEEKERTGPAESSLGNTLLHGTATDLRLAVRLIDLTGLQI